MRCFIYCDESGDSSFSEKSRHNIFSICALTVEENKKNKIKNTMSRKKAKLYKAGWPKNIEIKASVLHNLKLQKNLPENIKKTISGDDFIIEILTSLKNACLPRIDYIAVKKDKMTDNSFRNAPYGIVYNFYAGKILVPLVCACESCFLTVDKRNKEVHTLRHFDGYIETRIREEAFNKGIKVDFQIEHGESHVISGLQAVDFFSWAVYRKIAYNDTRFFTIFKDKVKIKEEWYCS